MSRRLVPVVPAALLALVALAGPAVAKEHPTPGNGKGKTAEQSPVKGGTGSGSTGPGDPSAGGAPGSTAGPGTGTGPGSKGGPSSTHGKTGTHPTPGKASPSPRSTADGTRSFSTGRPAPSAEPGSSSAGSTSANSSSSHSTAGGATLVRASAAPLPEGTSAALLPTPNPLLLPESLSAQAAPVDAENRSSSLPTAVPDLLVGAGLLSVAVGGTVLVRRRQRPSAVQV